MAYDKKQLFEKAKEVVVKHKLFFIEDICAMVGMSKETFYRFYPTTSNEYDELSKLLTENKIAIKVSMRKKWHDSDNATLQMGLMKLICSDEERKKLAVNYNVNEEVEKPIFKEIDLDVEEN